MITAFNNATIFTGEQEVEGQSLLILQDRIVGLVPPSEVPADAVQINCEGLYLAPGLIDLQIYGGGGYLFSNDPSREALEAISEALVQTGTTTYLITIATNSMEIYRRAFQVVKENPHPALGGLHLEGPYFNPVKRGAHIKELMQVPDPAGVESLLEEANGTLRMMTVAPEVCRDEVISILLRNGVIVSAGHSNATFEEAMQGFSQGIRAVTHLFNAMSPLHHRDTGLPGATMLHPEVYASIIADGVHVDFATIRISKKMMGPRLYLITDAVAENLQGPYVHIKKEDRYTIPDGTLSGSAITLLDAIRNCVQRAGINVEEAFRMATLYPAEVLQAPDLGRIREGAKANLILTDPEFRLKGVFLEGERVRLLSS